MTRPKKATKRRKPKRDDDSSRGFDAWQEVVDEFARESDRAGVILGTARIEELLYQLLERVLLPQPGNRDDLLDQDGPLATFSARIHMAYRLGLIPPALARTLHLIRRIRNSFAHESAGATLSAGGHRDRVRQLVLPYLGDETFRVMRTHFARSHFRDKPEPVVDFYTVLATLLIDLDVIAESAEPVVAPSPLGPPPPRSRKTAAAKAPTQVGVGLSKPERPREEDAS